MILLIDNYDSFTYNLVQRIGELDASQTIHVARHDKITVAEAEALSPSHLIISPGPCTPNEAGISNEIIRHFSSQVPLLGVCLGHQCIGALNGMTIRRQTPPMHGKTSLIRHDGQTIFRDMPNPFTATRYHSLVIDRDSIDTNEWDISATTEDDDQVMAIRKKNSPVPIEGLQFHPESFLTEQGERLLANFLDISVSKALQEQWAEQANDTSSL